MMNDKQICAGNVGDITFMCRPAMLPMIKPGNEGIGSKVNFPLENCLEVTLLHSVHVAKRQHFPCDSNS
jgi:hypothetical protein